jgi:hypothetical protein
MLIITIIVPVVRISNTPRAEDQGCRVHRGFEVRQIDRFLRPTNLVVTARDRVHWRAKKVNSVVQDWASHVVFVNGLIQFQTLGRRVPLLP